MIVYKSSSFPFPTIPNVKAHRGANNKQQPFELSPLNKAFLESLGFIVLKK